MTAEKLNEYFEQHPFDSLSKAVFSLLYTAIIQNILAPGTRINMSQLSSELNISRSPIQDACKKLETIRFLEYIPEKKGYFVSTFKTIDMQHVYEARKMFEAKAAFFCAKYHYFENLEQMMQLAEAFKSAFLSKDFVIVSELDIAFHELLVKSSHNPYLIQSYEDIVKIWRRFSAFSHNFLEANPDNPYINAVMYEHINICTAIQTGIASLAEVAAESHLDTVMSLSLLQPTEWSPF